MALLCQSERQRHDLPLKSFLTSVLGVEVLNYAYGFLPGSNCALISANSASVSTPLRCNWLASRRLASVAAMESVALFEWLDEAAGVGVTSMTSGRCLWAAGDAAFLGAVRGGTDCGSGVSGGSGRSHDCMLRRIPPTTAVMPHRKHTSRKRKIIKPPPFMLTPCDELLVPTSPQPCAIPASARYATQQAARCVREAANTAPRAAAGSCG